MIENVIEDFAKRIGIANFALNENGIAALTVEESAIFTFEKANNELLLYLTFPAQSYDDEAAKRILDLAHYKYNHPFNIFTGLYNDYFMILTRFEGSDLSAAHIENAFKFLMDLKARVEKN